MQPEDGFCYHFNIKLLNLASIFLQMKMGNSVTFFPLFTKQKPQYRSFLCIPSFLCTENALQVKYKGAGIA